MNKKRIVMSLVMLAIVVIMLLSTVTFANADTKRNVWQSGDKWDYGTSVLSWSYYSNYYVILGNHWSSAYNPVTKKYNSENMPSLKTSKASVTASFLGEKGIVQCGLGN